MPVGHFQEYVDAALLGSAAYQSGPPIIPMPLKVPQHHPQLLAGLIDLSHSSSSHRGKTFLTSFGGGGGGGNSGGDGGGSDNDSGSNDKEGSSDSTDAQLEFTTSTGEQMKLSSKSKSACTSDCKSHFAKKKEAAEAEADNSGGGSSGGLGGFMSAVKSTAAAATDTTEQDIQECEYFCEEQFSLACFPSDATTIVHQRGRVPLSELAVGDLALVVTPAAGDDSWRYRFEPVLAWLHRMPERTSEMLEVRHRSGQIQLTPDHMIFARQRKVRGDASSELGPSSATLARDLQPGDHLFAPWIDGEVVQSEVLSISRVQKKGLYAPLVDGGCLLVNGTVVSCYAIPEPVADTKIYRTVAHYTSGNAIQSLAHAAFGPLRSICRASQALRLGDTEADDKLIMNKKADNQMAEVHSSGVHSYAWAVYVAVMALSP